MLTIDPGDLVLAGDWHENTRWAQQAVAHAARALGRHTIIHLGDFGFRFSPAFVHGLDRTLAEHDARLYFLRGNHDSTDVLRRLDPSSAGNLSADPASDPWPLSDRIAYLPDRIRLRIGDEVAVVLGGAGSIDRAMRTDGASWWRDERIEPGVVDAAVADGPADVLLCHDVPASVPFPLNPQIGSFFEGRDPGVLRWCDEHRELLDRAAGGIEPRLIAHGHHHRRITLSRPGAVRDAVVECLEHDGVSLHRNVVRWSDLSEG